MSNSTQSKAPSRYTSEQVSCVNQAVAYIKKRLDHIPGTVVQLGTGLGGFEHAVTIEQCIPYSDIPCFPHSTVESHRGSLIIGTIGDKRLFLLSGRFHYYEGYSTREVTLPIRVMQLLGVRRLIITNASGGLNPVFPPGTFMIIRDHLNFLGENPLRGPNIEEWGPRFPDLSEPYSPRLAKLAMDTADRYSIQNVVSGVYVCIPGPSLETPAETRWLRQTGADAVGMSSVPEVIVANHGGMEVLALSVISNSNDPDNFQPIMLADIIKTTAEREPQFKKLLAGIISNLP
ncbi:MAG: purine-nucleoside phosphorylase [Desulfobacterales bacterium]|nr:MAG: purine-nucleoside phosphorylase [Desulfobacterales bacterium]